MKTVILETPYAGDNKVNIEFARKCMLDCLNRGEAPFASHLLYTQVLDDNIKNERSLGIEAGFAWHEKSNYTVVYVDLGISEGMLKGVESALMCNKRVEYRSLKSKDIIDYCGGYIKDMKNNFGELEDDECCDDCQYGDICFLIGYNPNYIKYLKNKE